MAGPHENLEHAEHAEHASHSGNKKIALLISVLALFLAFSETLGKSSQTEGIGANVEAANLWAFFQAKTIRRTLVETAASEATIRLNDVSDAAVKGKMQEQIDRWKAEGQRYRSEPSTREGSTELSKRAQEAEKKRDEALARYHNYEFASAAFQIGIVLASATIITNMLILSWISALLGVVGLAFMSFGLWAPHTLDFLLHASH